MNNRYLIPPEDQPTDMSELDELLTERGIKHKLRPHPIASEGAKEIIGYSPAGDWQIMITRPEGLYSVIRGMASFGYYEIMGITGEAKFSGDPERFDTPEELVTALEGTE